MLLCIYVLTRFRMVRYFILKCSVWYPASSSCDITCMVRPCTSCAKRRMCFVYWCMFFFLFSIFFLIPSPASRLWSWAGFYHWKKRKRHSSEFLLTFVHILQHIFIQKGYLLNRHQHIGDIYWYILDFFSILCVCRSVSLPIF